MRWRRRGDPEAAYLKHSWTVEQYAELVAVPRAPRSGRAVRGSLEALAAKWSVSADAVKKQRLKLLKSGWKPPKPPKPQPKIAVPDPGQRVKGWGGVPAVSDRLGGPDGPRPAAGLAQDRDFEPRERPCVGCGKAFETTAARRLLCAHCFGRGGPDMF